MIKRRIMKMRETDRETERLKITKGQRHENDRFKNADRETDRQTKRLKDKKTKKQ